VARFRNLPTLTDSRGRLIGLAPTGGEIVIEDADGRERSVHKIPFGAMLSVTDGQAVTKGDRLAGWDPYTRPIITDRDGTVKYQDLVDGQTLKEEVDEGTGIANRVVSEFKSRAKVELRPRITLLDESSGEAGRYLLPVGAILSVTEGQDVKAGDVLARIPREAAKTRDITGGLPRVAELFEARVPKDHGIIAKIDGRVEMGKDYKAKKRVILRPEDGSEPVEYLLPKGRHIAVQEGDLVRRGDFLIDGPANPHDILDVLGVEKLAEYLCAEIQEVYRLQGVKINDKHIEVIVRQMLQKVEITEDGDSTFLKGEQVDREELEAENAKLIADNKRPAEGKPVLLGITKASLQTRSFISAASFQETTRVLTEASVQGKRDGLEGLKENVIVGRLIPAGTGAAMDRLRVTANSRDAALRAQQAALAAASTEAAE
jgi:DNA-directed RNA polymerase subunit beta'